MHLAVKNPLMVNLLLGHGAEHSPRASKHGTTPLHVAAFQDQPDTIKILARAGVEVDLQAKDGQTALACAVDNGQAGAAWELLRHDARDTGDLGVLFNRALSKGDAVMCDVLKPFMSRGHQRELSRTAFFDMSNKENDKG